MLRGPHEVICHFGAPCAPTASARKLVRHLADATLGNYKELVGHQADEIKAALRGELDQHVIVFSETPDREIYELVAQIGEPFLVTLDRPEVVVSAVNRQLNLQGLPALRYASQTLSLLHDFAAYPQARILSSSAAGVSITQVIPELARVFGLKIDAAKAVEIHRSLAASESRTIFKIADLGQIEGEGQVMRDDAEWAARYLSEFANLTEQKIARAFMWPTNIMLGTAPLGNPVEGPIELVGGRRCLIYGPYFHLPPGQWQATVEFRVSDNLSGNLLKCDVFSNELLWEGSARLPAEGEFIFTLEFDVKDAQHPLQIRFFNWEGAIEGVFDLKPLHLQRLN